MRYSTLRLTRRLWIVAGLASSAFAQSVSDTLLSADTLIRYVEQNTAGHGHHPPSTASIANGRRIAFGGDPSLVILWREGSDPQAPERYVVSIDGEHFSAIRSSATEIDLVGATFDPLRGAPDFADSPFGPGGNLHLVQYRTQPLPIFAATIVKLGGDVLRYLGNNTHLVELSPAQRDAIAALPFVRWVGPCHPELRVEPEVVARLRAKSLGTERYSIQVAHRGLEAKQRIATEIARGSGGVDGLIPDGFLLDATLSPTELIAIARLDEVVWIDRAGEPQTYMDKVRVDGGADQVEAQLGLRGQGVCGEVLDAGGLLTHQDFQAPPLLVHNNIGTTTSHGTETTGIVFGNGSGSATARGLLPEGQGIVANFAFLGNRYQHTAELLAPPFEAVFQSNSWGVGLTTSYTNAASQIDDIAFLFEDFVILQAMGNAGSAFADAYAWAKNVVAVGGIRHFDTQNLNDDAWNLAGSIGPAADGRIKPDLSYWYDKIRCASADGGYTDNFSGTSAATPEVAGHFGLFFQMWHEETLGNATNGSSVFASRPKASTARAVVINGADAYPFNGLTADLTRTHQGWGRPDVERLLGAAGALFVVDESRVLQNLETATYSLPVRAGTPELRVTLVYKDLPGAPSATHHLVNDLSLRVTSPSNAIYWGNRGLLEGNVSIAGGAANTIDPIENVWIATPERGVWTVDVLADAIIADQHRETPAVDADFALVASGIEPVWRDVGNALAGAAGAPLLVGRGFLDAGTRYELEITNGAANRRGFLAFGFTNASVPFLGGTLVPALDLIVPIATDANGRFELAQVVPAGIVPGTRQWAQAWLRDATGPQNATASNALEMRFP